MEYCYRTISSLLSFRADSTQQDIGTTPKDVYETFKSSTYLEFGAKCISILRYLSEAGDRVPLDTHSRIMDKLNVPQVRGSALESEKFKLEFGNSIRNLNSTFVSRV